MAKQANQETTPDDDDNGASLAETIPTFDAPELPYLPRDPKRYRPPIALIGCGGITEYHLMAYRQASYEVVALCDVDVAKAKKRQKEFFPDAKVYADYHDVLARNGVEVVDCATHPPERVPIIEAALKAGKHVLSQKPFVTDLDVGERLVELAEKHGVTLAVNQNGRWAPYFSYMRQAVLAGLIGELQAAHFSVDWDHNWVAGTEFEKLKHLILYDFAIHWFDITACFFRGRNARNVFATICRSGGQRVRPPLMAQALVEYDDAQVSLAFNGDARFGRLNHSYLAGRAGSLVSSGSGLNEQSVTLFTAKGRAQPSVVGSWFPIGFHGTMAELLSAVEEGREPENSARNNLESLALCFAAVESAERGEPVRPGTVRKLPNVKF